jgi:hypothetical protein
VYAAGAAARQRLSAADLSLDRVLSQLLIEIDGMLYSLCFTLSALLSLLYSLCFDCLLYLL